MCMSKFNLNGLTLLFYLFIFSLMTNNRHPTIVLSVAVTQNRTYGRTYLSVLHRQQPFNPLPMLVLIESQYS